MVLFFAGLSVGLLYGTLTSYLIMGPLRQHMLHVWARNDDNWWRRGG